MRFICHGVHDRRKVIDYGGEITANIIHAFPNKIKGLRSKSAGQIHQRLISAFLDSPIQGHIPKLPGNIRWPVNHIRRIRFTEDGFFLYSHSFKDLCCLFITGISQHDQRSNRCVGGWIDLCMQFPFIYHIRFLSYLHMQYQSTSIVPHLNPKVV